MKFYDNLVADKFRGGGKNSKNAVYMHPEIIMQQLTDKEGLDKAYAQTDKLYVHGDTMYVAGSSYLQDYWDDLKIPFNQTKHAQRYKDADALLGKNPQIANLVGHSLGGSSVLELQKNHGERTFKTNTYGAPAASMTGPDNKDNHRYRNYGDPVSIFDRGAESRVKASALKHYAGVAAEIWTEGTVNPVGLYKGVIDAHSYDNFDDTKVSDMPYHHQPIF
jgi:pimeloyl-ACP methyl ester carboxylesterase